MMKWQHKTLFASMAFALNGSFGLGAIGFVCLVSIVSLPVAQGQDTSKPVSTDLGSRRLADGILTVVQPSPEPEETSLGPVDLELVAKNPDLAWEPALSPLSETLLEKSKGVQLRHSIYALEFAFKPLRMVEIALPKDNGGTEKKIVWYLIYRVRYLGRDLVPDLSEENAGVPLPSEPKEMQRDKVLFVPRFVLYGPQKKQEFAEKILPAAKGVIAARERVGKQLHDNFEMMRKISLTTATEDNELWGIATWTDIDPSLDFLAIHVEGLTNAYRVTPGPDGFKYEKKVLQVNFWRPGDSIDLRQDQYRVGAPAFEQPERVKYALQQLGLKERLDYIWIYR